MFRPDAPVLLENKQKTSGVSIRRCPVISARLSSGPRLRPMSPHHHAHVPPRQLRPRRVGRLSPAVRSPTNRRTSARFLGSALGRDGCPQPSVRRPTLRSSPSILHTPYSILSHYLSPPNGGLRTTRPTQDSLSGPRLSPCHHAHVSPRRLRLRR